MQYIVQPSEVGSFRVMEDVQVYVPTNTENRTRIPELSATELHKLLLRAARGMSRSRLCFCETLLVLNESGLYQELGYPSIIAYGQDRFGIEKTETYERLRVAVAIQDLPTTKEIYLQGAISWSAVRQITRVATEETEGQWIELAQKNGVRALKAEVDDANNKGRNHPRSDRYGLPDVMTRFKVDLHRAEYELLRRGLERIAAEITDRTGEEQVGVREALLYFAELALATDPSEGLAGRVHRDERYHTVLYHQCPDCHSSALATPEGLVEVNRDQVDRLAGDAEIVTIDPSEEQATGIGSTEPQQVEIDAPTPPAMRRKVLLRDGSTCSNPCCQQRAEFAHHIRFRSHGGPTALYNETGVCGSCHALIHAGLLTVTGDPATGLTWRPRGATIVLEEEDVPRLELVRPFSARAEKDKAQSAHSARAEKLESSRRGLESLGYSKTEATESVEAALRLLLDDGVPPESINEELVLQAVLRPRTRPDPTTTQPSGRHGAPADSLLPETAAKPPGRAR